MTYSAPEMLLIIGAVSAAIVAAIGAVSTAIMAWKTGTKVDRVETKVNGHSTRQDEKIAGLESQIKALTAAIAIKDQDKAVLADRKSIADATQQGGVDERARADKEKLL